MRLKKLCALLLAVALTLGLCSCGLSKEEKYDKAVADVKTGKYDRAIEAFESLKGYEDSEKYIMYARCLKTGDSGDYDTAIKSLTSMGDFKEAAMYIKYYTALAYEASESYEKAAAVYDEILLFKDVQTRVAALPDKILDRDLESAIFWFGTEDHRYLSDLEDLLRKKYSTSDTLMYEKVMAYASQWREQKNYEPAVEAYALLVGRGYRKAESALQETAYDYANALMSNGQYADASNVINERLSGYKDSAELLNECSYQLALKTEAGGAQNAQAAYDAFKELATYKDSADRAAAYETKYAEATSKREANDFDAAIALFSELGTYSDASAKLAEAQNAKAYAVAASLMNSEQYEAAIETFRVLNGYSDSAEQITECTYRTAEKLRESGKYDEAAAIYVTIRGYKDVSEILTNDTNIAKAARRAEYQPGNYVTFGTYPQTKSGTDKTPIEWLVLESDGETALLISRYALDCKPYSTEDESITWEKCTLRSWLNNGFYKRAFSAEEKKRILMSNVSADKNPSYSTNPGNATKDSVFLLSIVEAKKYFASNEARMCAAATDYAIKQGAYTTSIYTVDGRKACTWWLRSPGKYSSYAAYVLPGGSFYGLGDYVRRSDAAVRPCVRVRLF